MRDLYDGRTLFVQFFQQFHDFLALVGMEISGRLIGEYQLWFGNDRSRYCYELLLTA
jgi:hypothetical protein